MSITKEGNNISSTLFGKTWQAVLVLLFMHADDALYLRQLMRITGLGIGALQRELKELTEGGIIKTLVRGRQVYYQVNKECAAFNDLKIIVIKMIGAGDVFEGCANPSYCSLYLRFFRGCQRAREAMSIFYSQRCNL